MNGRTDQVLSTALTTAAVIMAVAVVKREFWPAPEPLGRGPMAAYFDSTWHAAAAPAIIVGSPTAPLQLVEFVDFECPVCRQAHHGVVRDLRARFRDSLAIRYVHFPLEQHRFARFAAQAVECADRTGAASAMIDLLFLRQDSLGIKSWGEFARDAGIRDTMVFAKCVRSSSFAPRIDSGYELSRKRNVPGTPSFVLNGWVIPGILTSAEFIRMAEAVLAGRDPTK